MLNISECYFISNYLIKVFYGDAYLMGTSVIYLLSSLIITSPLIGLYSIVFQSKEKSKVVRAYTNKSDYTQHLIPLMDFWNGFIVDLLEK